MNQKWILKVGGGLSGFLNGLLGTGGGILAVPVLKYAGYKQKTAQACASLFMLCMTLVSLITLLLYGQKIDFTLSLPVILGGVPGALLGAYLLSVLNNKVLQFVFGLLVIISGLRLLL